MGREGMVMGMTTGVRAGRGMWRKGVKRELGRGKLEGMGGNGKGTENVERI